MVTGSRSRSAAAQRIQSRKEAPIPTAACDPVGRIRSLGPKISMRFGGNPKGSGFFRWGTFWGAQMSEVFEGFRYSYITRGGRVTKMCMFTNCETSFLESVSNIIIQ